MLLPLECFYPVIGNYCKTGLDRRRRPRDAPLALLREARPGLHRQGDVGRGLAKRQAAVDLERQRRTTCSPTTWTRSREANAAPDGPMLKPVRVLDRRGPAKRHHRRDLLQAGRLLVASQTTDALPGLVDRPDDGRTQLEIEKHGPRGVRGARHREGARRDPALADHPVRDRRAAPTYGLGGSALVHYMPKHGGKGSEH